MINFMLANREKTQWGIGVAQTNQFITWLPPPANWLKININEALSSSYGEGGAGFVARDESSLLIRAQGFALQGVSFLSAELIGAW